MDLSSAKTLNNGVAMPYVGLGVWQATDDETVQSVKWALEAGYRHIDTAKIYGNEAAVGRGVKESGLPREKIFITTKLWNEDMRTGRQMEAFEESLKALGTEYVDLYLLHWAVEGAYIPSWKVLEQIYKEGRAKAIGVCNFQPHHLETLMASATVKPAINQFECHPFLTQEPLIAFCEKEGIACEAWGPLGGKGTPLVSNDELDAIGKKYGKSAAQVMLRWNIQRGVIVLPKSVHKERIIANSQLFDFTLNEADMRAVSAMNRNKRLNMSLDPDNVTW
ncbi:MAG: aldo/keto reductase [Deltaproteobacteria bacterium]|nr:aldo/keto reductase [Deltaproteobacteria bacterium]